MVYGKVAGCVLGYDLGMIVDVLVWCVIGAFALVVEGRVMLRSDGG